MEPGEQDRLDELIRTAKVGESTVCWDDEIVSPEDAMLYVIWAEESRMLQRALGAEA